MKYYVILCLLILSLAPVRAQEASTIKVETLVKSGASWDGNALPRYPRGKPEISILRITIPPHERLTMHQHPVINAGILLEGELTVVKKTGETVQLKAGEALVEVVNTWHYGKNDGDVPAVIVVFYAGVTNSPLTVKEK